MELDKVWEDCIEMWKWISEKWNGSISVPILKSEYFKFKKLGYVHASCFFCHYSTTCKTCPGRLVDSAFDCRRNDYSYRLKPKKFYQKLLELNAIRLERKENKNDNV